MATGNWGSAKFLSFGVIFNFILYRHVSYSELFRFIPIDSELKHRGYIVEFTNGHLCGATPRRATLTLTCGDTDSIDAVDEPSMCFYTLQGTINCAEKIEGYGEITCEQGFEAVEGACVNINECDNGANCGQGSCADSDGSFTCNCNAGFQLQGDYMSQTCVDIDECNTGTPCGDGGTCTNNDGAYECACDSGYELGAGPTCVNIDECSTGADCSVNGVCVDSDGDFTCNCNAGFELTGADMAKTCVDTDECSNGTANCGVGGTCDNSSGSFSCTCNAGFELTDGPTCSDIDECSAAADCGSGSCANSDGAFSCVCDAGFELAGEGIDQTCIDIDECSNGTADCGAGGSCVNSAGAFTCDCNTGFSLTDGPTCANDDECSNGTANCGSGTCSDNEGDFDCTCDAGFELEGTGLTKTCIDVDECSNGSPCGTGGACTNTSGAYTCDCSAGFEAADGPTCANIDECSTGADCGSGTCADTDGDFTCTCDAGFEVQGTGPDITKTCVDSNECADGSEANTCNTDLCINQSGSFCCAPNFLNSNENAEGEDWVDGAGNIMDIAFDSADGSLLVTNSTDGTEIGTGTIGCNAAIRILMSNSMLPEFNGVVAEDGQTIEWGMTDGLILAPWTRQDLHQAIADGTASASGDPHFKIGFANQYDICFDLSGPDGTNFNLIYDPISGLEISGSIHDFKYKQHNPNTVEHNNIFLNSHLVL